MLSTPRMLPSSSITIDIVLIIVCMTVSSSCNFCSTIPRPPSCDCSNTPDGYELRCSTFTVQVKPKAVVRIQCDNNASDLSVLSDTRIGEVDTLIIRLCPLPSVTLSQLMKKMDASNVSNVQLTYSGVNGNARDLFRGLFNVTSLTLHTNGTTQLTDDVFLDMPNLTFFDLGSNNIVLSKDLLRRVTNLQVLQLYSYNQTFLEPGIFYNLTRLRILVLSGNVVNLSRAVFSDINNLESLVMNSTKMTRLQSDWFADLKKLRKITLYANEFTSLPQKLFRNNPDLETAKLQDNRQTLFTLPSRMLADLTKLKTVTICNCNMSTLPEDLLWGSVSIQNILLNNNVFVTLPALLFKDCTNLEAVDISYNRITDLPNRLFSRMTNLKSLKINNNRLSVIKNELFFYLSRLSDLDLKDNRLTHIETQAFKTLASLTAVNLSNNMLTFTDSTGLSPLKHCRMLENIQLENNSLISIYRDWRTLMNLETLNLAFNKISRITYKDLWFKSNKDISVNVSYNNISEIVFDESPLTVIKEAKHKNLPVRYIFTEGNFIKCGCNVPSFILPVFSNAEIFVKNSPGHLQCARHEEYTEKYVNLIHYFQVRTLNCLLKKKYSLNCPEQCSCQLMISDTALLVDCSQRNLTSREYRLHNLSRAIFTETHTLEFLEIDSTRMTSLPSDLLLDLTALHYINLYGNEILSLPEKLFVNNHYLFAVNIEDNSRTLHTLPPGLLGNLTYLNQFTLRNCNMSTLPEDLLWGSKKLSFISLNRNAFTTFPELLFKDCINIRTLDISYNRITNLPNRIFYGMMFLLDLRINNNHLTTITNNLFSSLRNLIALDLKDNRLRHVESQAFMALRNLRTLDMSNNLLNFRDTSVTWTMSPLKFCIMLEDLQLANNSLTKIFTDWRQFRELETLNLARNEILQLKAEDLHFVGAKNTFVNLSYNNISEIDIFENNRVYKYVSEIAASGVPVKHYFIKGNPINCDCKVYSFLKYNGEDVTTNIKLTIETTTRSLQCDKIEAYTEQIFRDIPTNYFTCFLKTEYKLNCLDECSCLLFPTTKTMVIECYQTNLTSKSARENGVHNLSREVFSDVYNLETLEIKRSRMTGLSPDIFTDLIKLRNIFIYANKFQSLPRNLFMNNPELEIINIENNRQTLKTLPSRLLANLTKLKEVILNSCKISTLPEDLLWGSKLINTVSLKNNALTTLPEQLFIDSSELQTLDISFNRITDLPDELFSTTLNMKILKISNNQLTVIRNYLIHLNKLEILDLKYNRLRALEYGAFLSLKLLKRVDMSNNLLTNNEVWKLVNSCHNISFSQPWVVSCPNLEDIQLANNSLTTNVLNHGWRRMENLQTLNLAGNEITHLEARHFSFYSKKNVSVNLSYNNISEVNIIDSNFKYVPESGIHNVPVRHFFFQGNRMNCACKAYKFLQYHRDALAAEVKLIMGPEPQNLQCVNPEGYTKQLSASIPIKYFTCLFGKGYNLNCPEKCSCLFRISDKALIADCQQRNLTSMPGALPDLHFSIFTELNVFGNKIMSVKFPLGPGYYKVIKYNLSDNMVSEIDLSAFSPKLQILELHGNRINQLNKSSIEFLMNATSLTQLTLHNNPWRCDCTTKSFVHVIQNVYDIRKVKTLANVTCENGKEIQKISDTELCPVESKIVIKESYKVAILVLLFALLIGCLLVLYYRHQNGIKIWLYAHRCCLWFVTEDELDKDKVYDVFVSYAYQDEDFVMDNLVPRLEDEQYTLCLHQRDWIPGEFIPAQIISSVEASRRTLIILSASFLESVWGMMEFRVAHEQALRDRRVRVIVMLYGDMVPTDKLDSELRTYITMNTYVKWGDKWFWDKLRYAMPHSSKLHTGIPLQERT